MVKNQQPYCSSRIRFNASRNLMQVEWLNHCSPLALAMLDYKRPRLSIADPIKIHSITHIGLRTALKILSN